MNQKLTKKYINSHSNKHSMRILKITLLLLIFSSQACSMNELLGRPEVKLSELGPGKFRVGYVCTEPSPPLFDLFNAKENFIKLKEDFLKICNRDKSEALMEANKFCEAKNLKFNEINLDVFSLRQYSYNSSCKICQPVDFHYTINFECVKNEY